jgi:hypothetical protein
LANLHNQPENLLEEAEKELKLAKIKQEGLRDRMRKVKGATTEAIEQMKQEERMQVLVVNKLARKVKELGKLICICVHNFYRTRFESKCRNRV